MRGFHKKGIDTRALNILLAIFVIAMLLAGLHVWLRLSTIDKQSFSIKSSVGTFAVDNALAEFVFQKPEFFSAEKLKKSIPSPGSFTPPTDSDLESALRAWFLELGYVGSFSCGREEKGVWCTFGVQKGRSPEFSIEYKRVVLMPTEEGLKEVRFSGNIRE